MARNEVLHTDPNQNSDQDGRSPRKTGGLFIFLVDTPAWLVSMGVHTALLLVLALLSVGAAKIAPERIIVELDPTEDMEISDDQIEDFMFDFLDAGTTIEIPGGGDVGGGDIEVLPPEPPRGEIAGRDDVYIDLAPPILANLSDIPKTLIMTGGGGTRDPWSGRKGVFDAGGKGPGSGPGFGTGTGPGTGPPEKLAVARGLKWISEHQQATGGWNFDHTGAPKCQGKCKNPGDARQAVRGATAIALLPFLGCGMTHKEGRYKENVRAGLYFLGKQMKVDTKNGTGSFHEDGGTMYSHGLAAICLTEAYGMTKDPALRLPAQAAVNFIVAAQDPAGGGWRYQPREKGDTSVVGWQLMALKSGYMAYLDVPDVTPTRAMKFLDSVQMNSGANYGYSEPGQSPACTAIGLLCRMYYGWKQDNPALERGVEWLGQRGPSANDMYYNYYATQVMHHYGGPEWRKWDNAMRTRLIDTQITDDKSHEFGSWFVAGGDHGDQRGGRLYKTALSVMTLEVYYRYSPIYKTQSVEGGIRLE